jgi:hypothetical protein
VLTPAGVAVTLVRRLSRRFADFVVYQVARHAMPEAAER